MLIQESGEIAVVECRDIHYLECLWLFFALIIKYTDRGLMQYYTEKC